MKLKIVMGTSFAVLMASLLFALVGCNGDPGPTETETPEARIPDAVENQQHCPVMDGMPVDRSLYVDYEGERVYFCCPGCISTFQAEPEKYMEKLHAQHEDTESDDEHHDHHGHSH